MTRSPLQNILWLVGERVARLGVTATVFALVARYLEPVGFGRLNFALAISAVAYALANLGLDGLVVGELVRRPAQTGAVLGTAFRLRLLAGAASAVLLTGTVWFVPTLREDALLVTIVGLGLLLQPADVIDLCFQRHLESRRTVVVRIGTVLAGAALRLALIAGGAGLAAFAWAQVAEAALFAGALVWSYRHGPERAAAWSWDPEIARLFLRRGAPLALSAMMVVVALRLDQLLVRQWLGDQATGVYFAAARLIQAGLLACSTFTLSFFPGLAASQLASPAEFRTRLQAMFDVMSALGWVAAAGCTVFGPWLIELLYGAAYRDAGIVLVWQGWGCLFALSGAARWQFILLAAPTALNLAAALLSIATQLLLAAWLLPAYGLAGAAAAWMIAAGVSAVLTTVLFPALHPCLRAQWRGFFIPFAPNRWPALVAQFKG